MTVYSPCPSLSEPLRSPPNESCFPRPVCGTQGKVYASIESTIMYATSTRMQRPYSPAPAEPTSIGACRAVDGYQSREGEPGNSLFHLGGSRRWWALRVVGALGCRWVCGDKVFLDSDESRSENRSAIRRVSTEMQRFWFLMLFAS